MPDIAAALIAGAVAGACAVALADYYWYGKQIRVLKDVAEANVVERAEYDASEERWDQLAESTLALMHHFERLDDEFELSLSGRD